MSFANFLIRLFLYCWVSRVLWVFVFCLCVFSYLFQEGKYDPCYSILVRNSFPLPKFSVILRTSVVINFCLIIPSHLKSLKEGGAMKAKYNRQKDTSGVVHCLWSPAVCKSIRYRLRTRNRSVTVAQNDGVKRF